ncbi:MAG: hypothetical protein NVS3B26_05100 [Mycobacteriales bacterium]
MDSGNGVVDRTVAGRYRLLDRLGSGGMGTVWRAKDTVLGRDVAVKEVTFPPGVSDEERSVLRERTRREARAAARLDHPSAVTVYDVAEEDGTPFLVMELVDARTLSEVVRTDGPLSARQTAQVGLAVLGALEAAHAQGIVHRDVKPGNVLLRADGRVVLTDFGIATFAGDSSITSTGLLLGSPSYIAPERARGETPGPPSDLWSLGATLFTAVEGRPPYDKGDPLPTLTAVITGDHSPFVAAGPLVPVLTGLLEKDPSRRFDAARGRSGLEQVLATEDTDQATTAAPPAAGASRRAERTAALNLGQVAGEVRSEEQSPVTASMAEPAAARSHQSHPQDARAPRRSRAPLVWSGVALALVAALVLALTSAHPGRTTADNGAPAASSGSTPSAPAGSGQPGKDSASSRSSAGPAPAPAGWVTHSDSGWTVAVPASYSAGSFDGFPQYKDYATGRTLRVSTTPPGGGKANAVQDRRDQAASFARSHGDYREISIAPVSYRGYDAADWEFTYSSGGTGLHALSRVFVVGGRGYSLFFQSRASDDWSAARAQFGRIAAAFQP